MSECHIDNNLHLATGWVDVECDVTMLQHTFHSQEVLVIHLQSCKTLGKVFCTQLPECKMFTMVHSIGGNDSIARSLSMLGFRDVGFESFCISANELTMLSKSGNNLVSLPEKMHPDRWWAIQQLVSPEEWWITKIRTWTWSALCASGDVESLRAVGLTESCKMQNQYYTYYTIRTIRTYTYYTSSHSSKARQIWDLRALVFVIWCCLHFYVSLSLGGCYFIRSGTLVVTPLPSSIKLHQAPSSASRASFMIHGNHDDPGGESNLCAANLLEVDVLSVSFWCEGMARHSRRETSILSLTYVDTYKYNLNRHL